MAAATRQAAVRITELFLSIQGESTRAGLPTVFIRLTGCPLRCHYCDTAYAFYGGDRLSIRQVLEQAGQYPVRYVTVTGGEPLAQPGCLPLLVALCDAGYQVSLETGGAMDVAEVDPRVMKVMDLKTPGSGEVLRNRYENLERLGAADQIKFVICNRDDYAWACEQLQRHQLTKRCEVLFSPSHDELQATQLAEWILADRLQVRLQLQLHKYLWGNARGR